jgi:hypothetical protein
MVQKIMVKLLLWWKNHIADDVPQHLDDLFDNKNTN